MKTVSLLVALLLGAACLPRQSIAPFAFADAGDILALDKATKVLVGPNAGASTDDATSEGDDGGSGAVVLLREQRFLFQRLAENSALVHSEIFTHEAIKLETEAGFEHAHVQMGWPKNGTLVSLDARTIAPDGSVTPLSQSELFASEVKLENDLQIDARIFEFPHVEVGSVIELAYKIDLPGLYTSWDERILGEVPIRRYVVDISVDKEAVPAMRLLNTPVEPHRTTDATGMRHVSFELDDLPARIHERFAPSWRQREPWWVYHTVLYKYPDDVWSLHADWDDEVKSLGTKKGKKKKSGDDDGDPLADAPAIDIKSCGADYACVLRTALAKTNELTVFDDFDAFAFRHRSVAEIVASGTASAGDKAWLFWAMLKKAGVDARLAGVSRIGSERVNKEFPSLLSLDHTIVVSIFGDAAVWVDPSCESCRPGYLPPWDPIAVGPDGDKVKETLVVSGIEAPKSFWWSLVAPPETGVDDAEARTITLRVTDDGAAKIVEDEVRTGVGASLWRGATMDEDYDDARRAAAADLPRGAVVEKATLVTCDASRSRCERHFEATLPKYAWRGDGELAVPLDILGRGWGIDDTRKSDVVLAQPWRSHLEVKIVAPDGMSVVSIPAPRHAQGSLAEVETTATSSAPSSAVVTADVRLKPGRVAKRDIAPLLQTLDAGAAVGSGIVRIRSPER